jgi:hypothetical protein
MTSHSVSQKSLLKSHKALEKSSQETEKWIRYIKPLLEVSERKSRTISKKRFKASLKKTSICEVELNAEQLTKFRNAIKQNYLFEMFIGKSRLDIQRFYFIWLEDAVAGNSIGYVKNGKVYLATHLNFNIFYNKAKGVRLSLLYIFLIEL